MRSLIVNADDLGLTQGINRAVFELNRSGALTSATLMATGASFDEAVEGALGQSSLGTGCHVVLVDGQPVTSMEKIPTLCAFSATNAAQNDNNTPLFRRKLSTFAMDLLRGRIRESEIEAEATEQIRRLQKAGIAVTHLDTHKHTHMFPRVLRPLLRAALACGVRAIRNPFEPDWALHATPGGGAVRRMQVRLLRTQAAAFARAVREAGLSTTDGAIGVLATGTLDARTIRNLLDAMPEGVWELVCHPGYDDKDLRRQRTRLLASREIERTALLETIPQSEARLIHFGQLK